MILQNSIFFESEVENFIDVGTAEDWFDYNNKPTYFCDIDGTIIKHLHKFSDLGKFEVEILPGVINKFNEWDSKGYKIMKDYYFFC